MLPFLKPKAAAGMTVTYRKSDAEKPETANDDMAALEACGKDLIAAVQSGDSKAVAAALMSAHEICASMPDDVEGPQDNSEE